MDHKSKTWTVVHFDDDDTVEAVPSIWIHGDQCLWPPYNHDKLQKAIQNGEMNSHWPSHKITLFKDARFRDYSTARSKARKAEVTSDLNSDDGKNKRQRKKKFMSSSESESEDNRVLSQFRKKLPTPPKKKSRLSLEVSRPTSNTLTLVDANVTIEISESQPRGQPSATSSSNSSCNNLCTHCCTKNSKNKDNKTTLFVIKDICCDILAKVEKLQTSEPVNPIPGNLLNQVGIDFPMTTMEELSIFEEFFKNEEKYTVLVRMFSKMGGSTTGDFIRRCLAPIISNELAMKFSFIGRKEKENFSVICLSKAIVEAADKMPFIKDKKETESAIGSWLKRGKARLEHSEKNK
ncbi:unnamed protein product [Ceutorhynchus assimilis]|uniref:DUF4806 domain-containing protein n=1 Tax=Ceutorhynchus assimilis TaxID=467358 RepID=A0A9P0DTN9_9CUCU|nr:unnamed protein product [Ceutorhynchus assimilis]